jgi:hypothetical protein
MLDLLLVEQAAAPRCIRDAYAVFNALRLLGFPPEWIYFRVGKKTVAVLMKGSGSIIDIEVHEGPLPYPPEELAEIWKKWVTTSSQLELTAAYTDWTRRTDIFGFLLRLIQAGFSLSGEVARA